MERSGERADPRQAEAVRSVSTFKQRRESRGGERSTTFFAYPDYAPLLKAADYVTFLEVEQAVWELQQRVGAYVAAVEAAQRVPTPALPPTPSGGIGNSGERLGGRGGCCTQAQLTALARCESGTNPFAGDPSPWRTGYFGLEAGHPIGGLSLGEQIAMVEDIYARYGPRAWGCAAAFG